jgi:hypothetical protein
VQTSIDTRRQCWLPYVRLIADLYGLKDWVFEIDNDGPLDRNAWASIFICPGRKYGYLKFSQAFLSDTPSEQRMMVVHELTHCHGHMAFSFAQDHIPNDKHGIHQTLMEYGTDAIAVAIGGFFPLPETDNVETEDLIVQRRLRKFSIEGAFRV